MATLSDIANMKTDELSNVIGTALREAGVESFTRQAGPYTQDFTPIKTDELANGTAQELISAAAEKLANMGLGIG